MSADELKSFRAALKVGDLVDFESHKRAGWFVGEVSRIDKSWAGLRPDDVSIHNHQFGDLEVTTHMRHAHLSSFSFLFASQ